MDKTIKLGSDGIATVIVGTTGNVQEYMHHPQVRFINSKDTPSNLLAELIPGKTRVLILTEGIPSQSYQWALAHCRQNNLLWLMKKSNQSIYEYLKLLLPPDVRPVTQEEAIETEKRGKLKALIPYIDWAKSNSENARILLNRAVESGIKTTIGSVTQLVSIERRKQGRSDVPRSIRSKLDITVELFDKFIEEVGAMRDYVIELTEENRMLKAKLEKYRKALEGLNE